MPTPSKIQSLLKSAIYLEDASCRILGLTIYGTSWTAADDMRPEDGITMGRYWNRLFQTRSTSLHSTEPSPSLVASDSATGPAFNHNSHTISPQPFHLIGGVHPRPDGFVLPDIKDVAVKWQQIPSDADIVVTHMPPWRPELFSHIAQRVKPTLHLCGHDFAGYGVMWKRETLFSNAALQLTSNFPPVYHARDTGALHPSSPDTTSAAVANPPKTSCPSSTEASTTGSRWKRRSKTPKKHTNPPQVPSTFDVDFVHPQLYTPKPNGRPRPPRWQRRLPRILSQFFFNGGDDTTTGGGGGKTNTTTGCSLFRRSLRPKPTVLVSETQSSRAAAEHMCTDVGFIYDPDMRVGIGAMAIADTVGSGAGGGTGCVGGSGAGYSGGSTGFTGSTLCSSVCRRNPIVIDVYVVSDDVSLILPPYACPVFPGAGDAEANVTSGLNSNSTAANTLQ